MNNAVRSELIGRPLAEIEREVILATLAYCAGNRTHAARMLGISLRTIRNKLRKYRGQTGTAQPRPEHCSRPGRRPPAGADIRSLQAAPAHADASPA